eukprot:TRINITY_DN2341_c0_g1_i1.p1 TRINITY_DN2341_c0_g1~~TRINITY_DN2341_c0_g1_i1.p1  ORF type:complete len:130 (-),score=27.46 TRINITY_DN2341_c0_g1_i1:295-684(-)
MQTTYTYRPPFPVITTKPTLEQAFAATTRRDWLEAFGVSALSGGVIAAVTRPFSMKYGMGIATFGCVGALAVMGVFKSASKRLQGYEPNNTILNQFPYRLDTPGEQVRVEPFRVPTREELEDILRNPRQ